MSLKEKFIKLINEYSDVYNEVNRTQNYRHHFGSFIRNDIPNEIRVKSGFDQSKYIVKGSNGAGRWTTVPWIAVFDRRITESAQRGVYIVYLLNKDTKELYLTLNQGATDVSQNGEGGNEGRLSFTGVTGASSARSLNRLRSNAVNIQNIIGDTPFATDELITCGAPNYDAGAVCYIKYTLDNLPDDEQLYNDLSEFVEIYGKYAEWFLNEQLKDTDNSWWPEISVYNPGISKEKWLEMLRETDVIGENALAMFAGMYNLGGAATCAQLAEIYKKPVSHYIMTAVHAAERVSKHTGCPVMQGEENSKWWPVLFVGKNASTTDAGTYIWKIREELYDALTEYNILKYLPQKDIKIDFFNYIGSENDLNGYQKSYKLVFYKAMIDSMDSDGKARELDVTAKFRKFYEERANAGKITDKDVDPVIAKISESSDGAVRNVMIHNPLKVISDKGFVKKSANATGEDLLCFNEELMTSLSDDDWTEIVRIVEAKLKLYYKQIDRVNGGEKEMTVKEKINAIKEYIAAKGFNYEGDLIENFYLSLKSKPFVILAGTSGTGKTKLVQLFAEAIGAEDRVKIVPVRPDWSDSTDLFGYIDLQGNFKPGAIIDFLKEAIEHQDKPYFICLDEMNLARVEYYLSDFLSIIETRKLKENGKIETLPIVSKNYCRCSNGINEYGELYIPENLYIIGTVNMDETTFPFSKKVLDRANTIEFSYVNLMSMVENKKETGAQKLDNSFLKTDYLYLRDCDDTELIESICFDLEELNQILVKANLHVGYRVRDEISFYLTNNKKADLLSKEAAFDNEIMQKILPRVQGSSAAIKDVLSELFIKCAGDYTGFGGINAYEQMESYIEAKECKYPNSAKKIKFMMRRYEEDGFTSYWL